MLGQSPWAKPRRLGKEDVAKLFMSLSPDEVLKRTFTGERLPVLQFIMSAKDLTDSERLELLERLLGSVDETTKTALLKAETPSGIPPLHYAAMIGRTSCVDYLLKQFPSLYHQKASNEMVALHYAVEAPETLQYLLGDQYKAYYPQYLNAYYDQDPATTLLGDALQRLMSDPYSEPRRKAIDTLRARGATEVDPSSRDLFMARNDLIPLRRYLDPQLEELAVKKGDALVAGRRSSVGSAGSSTSGPSIGSTP